MTIGTIDESQRKAATVVGFSYLFALPPAIFAEFYVRTQLIVFDNAAQTARNIMAHERLFRLGTASNLTVFAIDVVLIIALYVVRRHRRPRGMTLAGETVQGCEPNSSSPSLSCPQGIPSKGP
jgi:hypothetical protein